MNAWNSIYTVQMANNLVKWWRTKFLNGYKQFSVDCNEGRVSDTEELLGRGSSDYEISDRLRAACTTPPLQTSSNGTPSSNTPTPPQLSQQPSTHLNLEEFSCDVSVEGGPEKVGQERQEFSFTLYDFDGHGKITKDDITGLVTTIYETLGSSVKVPHYGSKTIKVKLTVSPDQRKHVSATVIGHTDNKIEKKQQEPDVRLQQDFNVSIKQSSSDRKRHCRRQQQQQQKDRKKHYCCRKLEEQDATVASDDCSDVCSRVSGELSSNDEEGECTDDQILSCKKMSKRYQKHANVKYVTPVSSNKETNILHQKDGCWQSKKVKKKSTTLQRQELLEIIQANMDKNNLSFQTMRKPCNNHGNVESKQPSSEVKAHKHRQRAVRVSHTPLHYLANMVDPAHFYVDLASLQNTTQFPQGNCQYDKLIDAVMCVSNKKVLDTKTQSCRRHCRSKSNDLCNYPFRYQLLQHPVIHSENVPKSTRKSNRKTTDFEATAAVKRNIKKFPQVVLGHTSSPHHLRHRNRQEDQARAMAQVVRWLEQEFSSNLHTNENKDKTKSNSWSEKHDHVSGGTPANLSSSVERHEHHHVHEHIHHHYHHYQETPVVV